MLRARATAFAATFVALVLAMTSGADAQTSGRVAVWVRVDRVAEHDAQEAETAAHHALVGAGYEVIEGGALRAAVHFVLGGRAAGAEVSDEEIERLRQTLRVDRLLLVRLAPEAHRGGPILVQLRLHAPGAGSSAVFGRAEPGSLGAEIARLVADMGARGRAPVAPPPSASGPITTPIAPPVSTSAEPSAVPEPAAPAESSAPAESAVASEALTTTATDPAPAAPTTRAPVTIRLSDGAIVDASSAPTAEEPAPQTAATPSAPDEAGAGDEVSAHPEAAVTTPAMTPDRFALGDYVTRFRAALVGIAGTEGYGYGLGLRLDIPVVRLPTDFASTLAIGGGVGVTFDFVGLPNGDVFVPALPVDLTASWRIGLDHVELGARAGLNLDLALGVYTRTGTWSLDLVLHALVGAFVAVEVAPGVRLFGGIDVMIGQSVPVVFNAGIVL